MPPEIDAYIPPLVALLAAIMLFRRAMRRPLHISDTDRWWKLNPVKRGKLFELWCADLLRRNGFRFVHVSGRAGDQGVDIIAWRGLKKYAFQCKHYRKPLGNGPVQQINTGMEIVRASVGVVMTNSAFTKGAFEAAKKAGQDNPILLWDRETLRRMCR